MTASHTPSAVLGSAPLRLLDGPPPNLAELRELYNRLHLTTQLARGALLERPIVYTDGSDVRVGDVRRIVAWDATAGVWRYFENVADQVAAPAGAYTPGNWYYVSAIADGGSLAYVITGTAPGGDLVLDASSRRYLAPVHATSSTAVVPFVARNGRYRYRRSAMADDLLRFADNDNSTGWSAANVSLAAMMPPHARVARLRMRVRRNGALGSAVRGEVRTSGDTGVGLVSMAATAPSVSGVDTEAYAVDDVVVGATQTIDYQCSASPASGYGVTLHAEGFEE